MKQQVNSVPMNVNLSSRVSGVCVVMLLLPWVLPPAAVLCSVRSLNHIQPPVLLVHLYSANHAALACLLTALRV